MIELIGSGTQDLCAYIPITNVPLAGQEIDPPTTVYDLLGPANFNTLVSGLQTVNFSLLSTGN